MTNKATLKNQKAAVSIDQIMDYRQKELDVIFDGLPEATSADLDGAYPGKLFAIMGIQRLPRFFVRWITRILQIPLMVWAGKGFYDTEGANLWFTTSRKIPFGYYNVGVGDAIVGKGKVVTLDYRVDKNIGLLKPIMGEARKVGDNFYLARMMWRGKRSNACVLYFTLKK
jgi:hypothetical protein